MEKTLAIIKPDSVEKKLVGKIISKIERKFKILEIKQKILSTKEAKKIYIDLETELPKKIFNSLIKYMTRGPVIIMLLESKNSIKHLRALCGPTDPKKAKKSQLRSYSKQNYETQLKKQKALENIIHASKDKTSAKKEIALFFKK